MKERAFRPGSDGDPQRIEAGREPLFAKRGSRFEPGHRQAVRVKVKEGWHQLPSGSHGAYYNREEQTFWVSFGTCGYIAIGAEFVESWSQLKPFDKDGSANAEPSSQRL